MQKNIKFFIVGLATLFWFKGMYRILDLLVPDDWYYAVLLVVIALTIFYCNDGEFNELGQVADKIPPIGKKTERIQS